MFLLWLGGGLRGACSARLAAEMSSRGWDFGLYRVRRRTVGASKGKTKEPNQLKEDHD